MRDFIVLYKRIKKYSLCLWFAWNLMVDKSKLKMTKNPYLAIFLKVDTNCINAEQHYRDSVNLKLNCSALLERSNSSNINFKCLTFNVEIL